MSKFFDQVIRIHLYKVVLGVLLVAILATTSIYFQSHDPKWEAILAGIATGFLVAWVQLLLEWNEHKDIESLKALRIRKILPYREGKEYYEELINKAEQEILVLGNTVSRFLEDFADPNRLDKQALLNALDREVEVRILVPHPDFLNEQDRDRARLSKQRMDQIKAKYPRFTYKYFRHLPAHSVVKADDECLVGPVFTNVPSKNTPAIHAFGNSRIVDEYLKYFETEWENGTTS